ncbi:sugar porter family MFS transporter [Spirillospora sp. CA-142024]|uniref:sugar porter family MFS transporter n=1 Tax=Spirillospora sp. CA-142024 TaxID=3240036 RepID=UPI003D8CB9AF
MSATRRSPARPPVAVYAFGALAELLFGYDTGVIGVAMLSIKKQWAMGTGLQGFLVSSLLLGAAAGVCVAGRLADRWGRRAVISGTGVVFVVGGLGACLSAGPWTLVAFRFVMGLGVGASASVVSVYLVEVAPTRHRGAVGGLGQLMVVLGIMLSFAVGYGLQPYGAWRWMFGLSIVPALVLSLGAVLLPETPRWLLLRGRTGQARDSLTRLGRGADADAELAEIAAAVRTDAAALSTLSVLRVMTGRRTRRALVSAAGLAVLAQFVGTNAIIYFAPSTLVRAGFGDDAAVAANLAVGTANITFTLIGLALVDRVGRRPMLMAGAVAMGTAMAFLGTFTALASPSAATAWTTLACMIVFLASFAATWGACVRVVVSELFPSSIRGSAVGTVLMLGWLANFTVSQSFPSLLESDPAPCFFLFAAVGILALLFVWKVVPETGGGRALEEISGEAAMVPRGPADADSVTPAVIQ